MKRKDLFKNYIETQYKEQTDFSINKIRLEFNTYDRNFKKFLPCNKNVKILEIGFGTGYFLKYLLENGYRNIYGIELSDEETEFVKKNVHNNVECVDETEKFLDKHQNEYDFICMFQVLEHIPKSETINLLKKIRASLRNNGIFIATVPNSSNPFNIFAFGADFTHEFIFNAKSLAQVNKLAAFSDTQIYPCREENLSWHSKITNITAPIFHFLLKIFVGLNRCYLSPNDFYTKNLLCVCRK